MSTLFHTQRFTCYLLASLCCLQTFSCLVWGASEEHPTTVEALQSEIDRVTNLPGGKQLANSNQKPFFLWVNQIHLGNTNVYSGTGERYLAVQLTIGNRSYQTITIPGQEIQLQAGAKTYQTGVTRDDFETGPLRVEGEVLSLNQLQTPKSTSIEAGNAKTIWCLYFGLPEVPRVPQMRLIVKDQQGEVLTTDLNEMQNSRLALTSQTIGPANCLKLFQIHGSLNTVNAALLAHEIESAHLNKIERVIIEWKPEARDFDEQIADWLIHSTTLDGRTNALYRQSPNLPELRLLLLAALPKNSMDDLDDAATGRIYVSTERAVTFALQEIYQRIDHAELLKSIHSDNPLIVQAALNSAGHRLDTSAFDYLNKLATLSNTVSSSPVSSNLSVQKAALSAMAYQGELALPILKTELNNKDSGIAEAAFVALLNSTAPQADQVVLKQLEGPLTIFSQVQILKLLQSNYRPAWNTYITEALSSEVTQVRQTAYRILSEVGHTEIQNFLKDGLVDSNIEVRTHVFEVLTQRSDHASQSLAMEYALERLKAGEVNDSIIALVTETLDPRAAPLLFDLLKNENQAEYHTEIIQLLAEVGDNTIAQKLRGMFETLKEDEQVAVLNMFSTLQFPGELELAEGALKSKSAQVQQCALEVLQEYDGDAAVAVIVRAMDSQDQDRYLSFIMSLGRIGTPQARIALNALRPKILEEADKEQIAALNYAFDLLRQKSPAVDTMMAGDYHFERDEYKDAIKQYELATEIDPELSYAWSRLAMVRLRLEDYELALKEYQKAYQLDPYDGQSITGLGIVLSIQGEWKKGIQITEDAAKNFPTDNIYAYNTACVYGRALEAIAKSKDPVDPKTIEEIRTRAITVLEKSIELGFDEFSLMKTDPDLDALRDHPKFAPLLGGS